MGVEGLSGGCRRENRGTQAGRRDPSSLQRGGSGRIEAEQASFGHELVEGVGDLQQVVEDLDGVVVGAVGVIEGVSGVLLGVEAFVLNLPA